MGKAENKWRDLKENAMARIGKRIDGILQLGICEGKIEITIRSSADKKLVECIISGTETERIKQKA